MKQVLWQEIRQDGQREFRGKLQFYVGGQGWPGGGGLSKGQSLGGSVGRGNPSPQGWRTVTSVCGGGGERGRGPRIQSIPTEHLTEGATAFETSSTGIPRGHDGTLDGNRGKSGEGVRDTSSTALVLVAPDPALRLRRRGDSSGGCDSGGTQSVEVRLQASWDGGPRCPSSGHFCTPEAGGETQKLRPV